MVVALLVEKMHAQGMLERVWDHFESIVLVVAVNIKKVNQNIKNYTNYLLIKILNEEKSLVIILKWSNIKYNNHIRTRYKSTLGNGYKIKINKIVYIKRLKKNLMTTFMLY